MTTRFVEFPDGTSFRVEEGDGFRTYIGETPGLPPVRIQVAWGAVSALEDCVVGRVGAAPAQEWVPPRVPSREWLSTVPGRHVSGPWALELRLLSTGGRGWFLTGPAVPSGGLPMGVWSAAPLHAADVWIFEHRRVAEQFPGERNARRMLSESAAFEDRPRSRESVCRGRWLGDLCRTVMDLGGVWGPERVRSALRPDAVSEREAIALLDRLVADGVLVHDPVGAPQWVRPCDPAGGAS
jgi:hypothetical protein